MNWKRIWKKATLALYLPGGTPTKNLGLCVRRLGSDSNRTPIEYESKRHRYVSALGNKGFRSAKQRVMRAVTRVVSTADV
jgi:hypothetical protein